MILRLGFEILTITACVGAAPNPDGNPNPYRGTKLLGALT